jgi:hypothetical protein
VVKKQTAMAVTWRIQAADQESGRGGHPGAPHFLRLEFPVNPPQSITSVYNTIVWDRISNYTYSLMSGKTQVTKKKGILILWFNCGKYH